MSDDSNPTINITRGSRSRKRSSTNEDASPGASDVSFRDVATEVAKGVRNVFLAGLGAISYAEQAGADVFDALVEEGKTWERTRRETTERVKKKVDELRQSSEEAAQATEERVQSEVDAALGRVGVPKQSEIDDLKTQVDDLTAKIDRLTAALERKQAASEEQA